VSAEVELRMLEGSEFQTVGVAVSVAVGIECHRSAPIFSQKVRATKLLRELVWLRVSERIQFR